ncbi:MAG: hypothetical protein L0G94_05905 [Brachybacterium sp.]|uniref:hypothetical protein n=1 Tax=Brachybacterium sp. TaxID=1891286 RepID=UPI002649C039|nr:hypothetical protein [Brachybacterium sp.]MDN5686208.1 hypothetical protein [Brachybacterium sp.]
MSTDGQLDADGVRALFRELSGRLDEAGAAAQLFVATTQRWSSRIASSFRTSSAS